MTNISLKEEFFAILKSNFSDLSQDFLSQDALLQDVWLQNSTEVIWQNILTHYQQPNRHYHTLKHIEAMYQYFLAIKNQLHNPSSVLLALVFHDVIYDPTKTDNEAQSAIFLQHELSRFLPKKLIETASELILATQKHQLADPNNSDMAYFLDMDLAILGQDTEIYQTYVKAIRQEYHHISESDFRLGRTVVLQNFLQRERLFFSDYFFDKYETQARQNLAQEIVQL